MNRFPKDCWEKNCQHFHVADMSIDDLHCICDILRAGCDACDEDFCFLLCPLDELPTEEGEVMNNVSNGNTGHLKQRL